MRISDWSSDVCSSDLVAADHLVILTDDIDVILPALALDGRFGKQRRLVRARDDPRRGEAAGPQRGRVAERDARDALARLRIDYRRNLPDLALEGSEEHTSELQSLMRISYAGFCLKKKKD